MVDPSTKKFVWLINIHLNICMMDLSIEKAMMDLVLKSLY